MEISPTDVREVQVENIHCRCSTLEVSQLDRSRDESGHKSNMQLIDATLDVFQFETPSSSVREEQK